MTSKTREKEENSSTTKTINCFLILSLCIAVTLFAVFVPAADAVLKGGSIQGTPLNLDSSNASVTTLAGSGVQGSTNATGTEASFTMPYGITTDGTYLFVADSWNNKIRKIVISTGVVTTLAGSGAAGSTDETGTAASFNMPVAITTDGTNLFVADNATHKIRQIVISSGVVTTLAGSGAAGSTDETGTAASFNMPSGLTTDGTYLFVADTGNNKIRQIVISTGVVTTLAGSGAGGFDDGTGAAASFALPADITTDGTNLFVADYDGNIRKIVISSGVVTTLAGSGAQGSTDATGTAASFNWPRNITTDGTNLFVSEEGNLKIRKIVISTGVVTTLAGSGVQGSTDATGIAARFNLPAGITTDGTNLFVADASSNKIRKISEAYTVTTTATNGTITSTTNPTVNNGATTTVTGSANAGYYFTGVSGCDGTPQSSTDQAITTFSYTTGAITTFCTVTATFAIKTYTITVTGAGINGGIMVENSGSPIINATWNGTVTGGDNTETVNYGAGPYSIAATANAGRNVSWSDCNAASGNGTGTATCTISAGIAANKNVTATFAINTYTVTTTATNGTITSTNNPTVNHGNTTTVAGSANAGYYFTGVSGCGGTAQSNTDQSITIFSYTTVAITSACTVTATFAIKTYAVTTTATNGTITSTNNPTVNYGSTTTFTLTPDVGYVINTVTGCGGTRSGNTYTTGTITADCTVSATFVSPNQWITHGPEGGELQVLAISPNYATDQTVYAGTNGGLFKTTNGGTTWIAAGVDATIRSLAISPNYASDQTVYTVTASYVLLKTTNGGTSWNAVATGALSLSVAISPNYASDQTVYAGTLSGVFKTTNGGTSWSAVNSYSWMYDSILVPLAISTDYANDQTVFSGTYGGGVVKTTNGGTSWSAVNSGLTSTYLYLLAVSPNYASDQTVYAVTNYGVFKTTNGGTNWSAINSGLTNSHIETLAISPNYASDQTVYAGTQGGVFKTTNGGTNWSAVNSGVNNTTIKTLAISPNYASGPTVYAGTDGGGVFKTTNGGTNWSAANSGMNNTYIDSFAMSPNYASDQTVYAGTYGGGSFKTTNGGTSWSAINSGLNNTKIKSLVISPNYVNDQTVYAGTSGGVFKTTNGGTSWSAVNSGVANTDIRSLVISPNYASDQAVYAGTMGGVFKTTNGGTSWSAVNSGLTNSYIYSLAISPNYANDQTVYAGTQVRWIFKTTNGGTSWSAIDAGMTDSFIESLAISPNYASDQTVYAGTSASGVLKTMNGGTSWSPVNSEVTNTTIKSLAISPNYASDQTVYAGTYGGGVFKTTNGGTTWSAINAGVTNSYIWSLAISPSFATDQTVYVGTMGDGVFKVITAPESSVSPTSQNFGNVDIGSSSTQPFTITTTGMSDLTVSSISLSGGDIGKFSITTGTCAGLTPTLKLGSSCTINVTFSPTSSGVKSTTLVIASNAVSVPTLNVPLSGTGVQYVLTTAKAGAGSGRITSSPPGIDCGSDCSETYGSGTSVTLTATPNTGSTFGGWSGDSDCSDGSVTVNADKSCTAVFSLNTYTATTTAINGSITSTNNPTVNHGAATTVTGSANANYYFTGVSGCGGTAQSNTDQSITSFSYTTGAITSACTVTATFAIKTYAVTTTATNGTITSTNNPTVNYGNTTTVAGSASANYYFTGVSGCGGTAQSNTDQAINTFSYTTGAITSDCTVTANFAIKTYAITPPVSGHGTVICFPSPVNHTANTTCTIMPETGYHLESFLVDGGAVAVTNGSYVFSSVTSDHTISATFAINQYVITTAGSNGGITCSPATVSYGSTSICTVTSNTGYNIELVTGCGGSLNGSTYTTGPITADCTVTASFAIQTFTVTASAGSGGSISPAGAVAVNYGGEQAVKATADTGYHIADVKVDGTSVGTLAEYKFSNVVSAHTIEATFELDASVRQYKLSVQSSGKGSGIVSSSDGVINCTADSSATCSSQYFEGSVVILKAEPGSGSTFSNWMNCPAADGDTCSVTMSGSKAVLAVFGVELPSQYALTVGLKGSGSGNVTAAGIDCGTDCAEVYNAGTAVTLTAVADSGFTFAGWAGGECSGTDTCSVAMNSDIVVTAAFIQAASEGNFSVTVIMDGAGTGTVTASAGELECDDSICSATYTSGSSLTLMADPEQETSLFSGWDGCNSVKSGKCTIKMTEDKIVIATFIEFPKLAITVNTEESEYGIGTGTVVSAGISCGNAEDTGDTDCDQTYNKTSKVILKAVADKGSVFTGWDGCDTVSNNTCILTIDEDKEVAATFEPSPRYEVAVTKDGNGGGKVTAAQKGIDNTGINCDTDNTDCASDYSSGTTITLTAKADQGSKFLGWSGYPACEGKTTSTCRISKLSAKVDITATFGSPEMSVATDTLDFGDVDKNDTSSQTFTITNNGYGNLTASFKISGTDAKAARMFKVYSSGKAVSKSAVAAGTTSEFEVRFKPTSVGDKAGTLTLSSNDPNNPKVEIQLSGTGK